MHRKRQEAFDVWDLEIKHFILMGDSLSDRGTLYRRKLLGCIPMSLLSGLAGYSPEGRFTNGLAWSDHISATIANDFTIKRFQERWHMDNTDIADAIIIKDQRVLKAIHSSYSLDNDRYVRYRNKLWVRSYCEGGLTSHNYRWEGTWNPIYFFTRLITANLDQMRSKLNRYDRGHEIPFEHKLHTLVIEWSGANDLITVNAEPKRGEADKAIAARMHNITELIESGYRHFILFNLPNLSLTPRYQNRSHEEQLQALEITHYFNQQLHHACNQIQYEYPYCTISLFDLNQSFEALYHNPPPYLFDKKKRTIAYIESDDFRRPKGGLSPAEGYMFYDDLHPSADMAAYLASIFYNWLKHEYELIEPDCRSKEYSEKFLIDCFRRAYAKKLEREQNSFFGQYRLSRLDFRRTSLEDILKHAFLNKGHRTWEVLHELGWIDSDGNPCLRTLAFEKAFHNAQKETNHELSFNL